MKTKTIVINAEDKITSIRVREKTKQALESIAIRKETHEEIILRLIKLISAMNAASGTEVFQKNNAIGIKYERKHQTIPIKTEKHIYSIVCTYNDLSIYNLWRQNKRTMNKMFEEPNSEWELDLEIVNVRKDNGAWESPQKASDKKLILSLYLAAVKSILEQSFDIKLYELSTDEDYFSLDLWKQAYTRNNLSEESYSRDIEKRLH